MSKERILRACGLMKEMVRKTAKKSGAEPLTPTYLNAAIRFPSARQHLEHLLFLCEKEIPRLLSSGNERTARDQIVFMEGILCGNGSFGVERCGFGEVNRLLGLHLDA